jgi:hypothetical protein
VNPDIASTNLGMEFLAYILQEGYENRYAPLNIPREEPFNDLCGTWIGDVSGANYGSLELTFEHPDNLSTLHGILVFTDHVYGRVQYTMDLEMSGNRIRGFVRNPVGLEARESILHPPSSLIGGYLSQDTQELQGVWVTSGDRAGDFVVRIKS